MIDSKLHVITMRSVCTHCYCERGSVTEVNGQDVVRCVVCGTWAYNQPKSESGKPQRMVRTRASIRPAIRARILERDNYTCVMCHSFAVPLHVGHLLSVADGKRLGATEEELFADDNLAAMCEECNLGQGKHTVSLRLLYRILQARLDFAQNGEQD